MSTGSSRQHLPVRVAIRVAIIYQALPPPVIGGLRKEAKPGGYSDSGADIAYCLRRAGIEVVTPASDPEPSRPFDWVYPDTAEGLAAAAAAGATVIWANTVLFSGHPLERYLASHRIVGQLPARQEAVDDKFATNARLRAAGLPVARAILVARQAGAGVLALDGLTEESLAAQGLAFPLIVKPVRGRGNQGVSRVLDLAGLLRAADSLLEQGLFGDLAIVEQYLEGEELTVTVMPDPAHRGTGGHAPLVLPPARRFNHADSIAPYNGAVAVSANSVALKPEECAAPQATALMHACARVFDAVGALAPIRIDCRADASGRYAIFDVNMKPNMTGAGRPGREDQDSLCAISARALGWTYAELLGAMLDGAWTTAGFAPTGKLRASINLGNPILACQDEDGGVRGVSVDLAGEFARMLGVELELVVVDAAGKSVEVVASEQADIGFFAIDPLRGADIAFSAAYVLIEGCYLVKQDSPLQANEEVDAAANRVVVGKGSAYDLYLSRTLQYAQILRAPTSPAVVDTFMASGAEVAAGVRQQLEADARRFGGLRLLDGHFMVIRQAMGTPRSRGKDAAAFLARFVDHVKGSGFVAAALARHRIDGASVAPPAA